MFDSRTEAGKIQDELGTAYCARNKKILRKKKGEITSSGLSERTPRSNLKKLPIAKAGTK